MDEQFAALLAELDFLLGEQGRLEDTGEGAVKGARAAVDGEAFVLGRHEEAPGLFTVHCRIAPMPPDAGGTFLLRLLAANVGLATRCGGSIGVTSVGREIVYSYLAAIQGTTAQQLLAGLCQCASLAKAWRAELLAGSPATVPETPLSSFTSLV